MITINDMYIYIYLFNKVSFNIHKQSHLQGEQYRGMELALQLNILNNIEGLFIKATAGQILQEGSLGCAIRLLVKSCVQSVRSNKLCTFHGKFSPVRSGATVIIHKIYGKILIPPSSHPLFRAVDDLSSTLGVYLLHD